jgi:hypothetical protein
MRRIPPSLPLCLLVLLVLASGRLAAQEGGDASEGAPFLLLPVGAQAVGMGRAVTPLSSAESVFWNPAGLAELADSRLLFYRADNVAGESTAASGLFSRPSIGVIGITYNLLDVGEQDFTDEQNNVLGTISFRNHLAVASVATRFIDRVNVGVNFKVVQFRQSCRGLCLDAGVTATTYAVDAGLQITRLAGLPLRVGEPLPTRVRVGVAYEFAVPEVPAAELRVGLTAEVEDRWRDLTDGTSSPALYLGTQFSATVQPAVLQLRAGYVIGNGEQVDGAAVGVGIRYNRFDLGIAKSLASNIAQDTEPVQVTFGLIF